MARTYVKELSDLTKNLPFFQRLPINFGWFFTPKSIKEKILNMLDNVVRETITKGPKKLNATLNMHAARLVKKFPATKKIVNRLKPKFRMMIAKTIQRMKQMKHSKGMKKAKITSIRRAKITKMNRKAKRTKIKHRRAA